MKFKISFAFKHVTEKNLKNQKGTYIYDVYIKGGGGGEGGSQNLLRVCGFHYFKQYIYCSFLWMVKVGVSFVSHYFVDVING